MEEIIEKAPEELPEDNFEVTELDDEDLEGTAGGIEDGIELQSNCGC